MRQQCTCMSAPGYATQSACKHSPCRGTSYCLGFEFSFDCWSIRSNTAITATLVFPICMYIYMEHALAMHACVHERVLHRTTVLLQAQVTELVLQRFQSAETADLPALLRFLLQHVDSQNGSQVLHLCALYGTLEYQVGSTILCWSSCCHQP